MCNAYMNVWEGEEYYIRDKRFSLCYCPYFAMNMFKSCWHVNGMISWAAMCRVGRKGVEEGM